MKSKLLTVIVALLFIVACGTAYLAYSFYQQESVKKSSLAQDKDEKEKTPISKEIEQVKEQGEQHIGFEMNGYEIQKAENVPSEEGKVILEAFDEYINALNEEKIDRYMETISKNPEGFKYDEEQVFASEIFEQFDIIRQVDNVTITKYTEEEAQVFANMKMHSLQLETNVEHESTGRQVTVFVKEDGDWKVTSVYYIENDNPKEYIENDNLKEQVNKQEVYDFMEREFNSITNYGETYVPEKHDPMVAKKAAEYFGITQEEADAMYIEVAMNMYK